MVALAFCPQLIPASALPISLPFFGLILVVAVVVVVVVAVVVVALGFGVN